MIREENNYTIYLKGYNGEQIPFEVSSIMKDNELIRVTDSGVIQVPIFV